MKGLLKYGSSIALLLSCFCANAQVEDPIKKSMRKMAEEKKYGIIFCQVGSVGVTSMSTAFVGLIDIDLQNSRLDTILSMKELQAPESQKALMQVCQQLVGKGVNLRQDGNDRLSLLCYRLPLYLLCEKNEMNPARIVSGNMWVSKQQVKYGQMSNLNGKALQLVQDDATYLLKKYQTTWKAQHLEKSNNGNNVFHLMRRMAEIAGNVELRRDILLAKLAVNNQQDYEVYLTGIMEELSQTSSVDILINKAGEKNDFERIWQYYLQYRTYFTSKPTAFANALPHSLRQFELVRSEVQAAGGSFGHKLSYQVSEYMQLLGRDLSLVDVLNGKILESLKDAERTRGRSLGDWIARSHATKRMVRKSNYAITNTNGSIMEIEPANLSEIGAASRENNANILIYLTVQDRVLAWLIKPDGNYYFSSIKGADSLISKLLVSLPYNIIPSKSANGNVQLRSRSTIKGSNVGTGDEQRKLLSALFSKLLPDSIGITINNGLTEKLVIIPDGLLNYVPFQALQNSKGDYLLKTNEISYWPSITAWLILKDAETVFSFDKKSDNANDNIKILGNPIFKGSYPTTANGKESLAKLDPLPGTASEINAIGKIFTVNAVQQSNVTVDAFLQKQKVNIVHLATHGYTNVENGMRSFIAFSDGPLYAETMYENAGILKSRMVVLSACQTGLGALLNDSPISLTNSFFIGGANSVVSTLWSIDDDASAELMVQFYKKIKEGSNISSALRQAQLSLMQQQKWSSPYYWAAFKPTGVDTNPLGK